MITLITGKKGFGKTKKLIQLANEAVEQSNGNVVVIEKGAKLTYDITHRARLIDTDQYKIEGFDSFYGFISGLCAGNYDVTDILIDSTLKICGQDPDALASFLRKADRLAELTETNLTFSVSMDAEELPTSIEDIVKKI